MLQLVCLALLCYGITATTTEEYCQLCADHTMCLYSGVGPKCKLGEFVSGVSQTDQNTIVNHHNELRNKVAMGEESRGSNGSQPSATDMKTLKWDPELAEVAQRWADQCNFTHDSCRDTPSKTAGQNIFMSSQSCSSINNDRDWTGAMDSLYNEVKDFDQNNIDPFKFTYETGHYTQVVWANTDSIGCGFTRFQRDATSCSKYYACNYGPAGNFVNPGTSMYKKGAPRSSCASSPIDSRYPGLCG